MPSKKTLLLHVGMGRAGSSAIQKFLAQNRQGLLDHGWAYPDETAFGLPQRNVMFGNFTAVALLSREGQSIDERMDCFSSYLDKIEVGQVLLSSEWAMGTKGFLQRFADVANERGYSTRVLIYFREQCEWLLSAYAQKVKTQDWTLTMEEYVKQASERSRNLNYYVKFMSLVKTFGRENVIARIYDRERLVGGDAVADLLDVMQVEPANFSLGSSSVNASSDLVEVELLRLINKYHGNRRIDKVKLLNLSQSLNIEHDRRLYTLVPPELLQSVRERYTNSNERLRKELTIKGRLFNSRIPQDYQVVDAERLVPDTAVAILVAYILSLEAVERGSDAGPAVDD